MTRRYVVLGNGIAGQTCAEELRAHDPDCSIVMIAAVVTALALSALGNPALMKWLGAA